MAVDLQNASQKAGLGWYVQRDGAGQLAVSEDAEEGQPDPDQPNDFRPVGAIPALGDYDSRLSQHGEGLAQGHSGVISAPGFLTTESLSGRIREIAFENGYREPRTREI